MRLYKRKYVWITWMCICYLAYCYFKGRRDFDAILKEYATRTEKKSHVDQSTLSSIKEAARVAYEDRRKKIQFRCQSETRGERRLKPQDSIFSSSAFMRLYYSDYFKFAYCAIPKAGSSTVLGNMNLLKRYEWEQLGGIPNELLGDPKVREAYHDEFIVPNITLEQLSTTTLKFAFVREPFSRLVSRYYVSEFEGINDYLNKPIIPGGNSTYFPPPKEFVEAILKQRSLLIGHTHIISQWLLCDFCNLDYDIIGYVDTYAEDLEYMKQAMGWENILTEPVMRNTLQERSKGHYKDIDSRMQSFFKQVPKNLIKRLFDEYLKQDVITFGDMKLFDSIVKLGY